MIILINGTYGVGKTTIANEVNKIYKGLYKVLDPDELWYEALKNNRNIAFGGTYPQNNKKFLKILESKLKEELEKYEGIIIIPMTITEDLSYNLLVRPNKDIIKQFVLLADEDIIKQRIYEDNGRDNSLSINNIKRNNQFLNNISDATFIDTSNMSVDKIAENIVKDII